ncbi:MAG: type III pantothenate kinase [Betaproteobacteria bacterium]|jgi:pantothenate kinase, type III|nr:type III pantothenate kinase [Betaproteobacteria bacterium]
MRHLLLDHGNSRLKWGLYHRDHWESQGHLPGHDLTQLEQQWIQFPTIDSIHGVSVGPSEQRHRIDTICHAHGQKVFWLTSQPDEAGVTNHYLNPSQLGADRWMALIAARHLNPEAATLVVMAGTATTIDSLDSQGNFKGGIILPGIGLMRQSLFQGTADLPAVHTGTFTLQARTTQDAIHSGILAATLGAIALALSRLDHATILLGGGFHEQLSSHLPNPQRIIPDLVLEGLKQWMGHHPEG